MNRKLTLPAVAFALAVGLSGCELGVTNPNAADKARALASPGDVETLISSSYSGSYWQTAQYTFNWGMSAEIMSNHGSSAWGNYGMNDAGREPREPLNNQSSYSYAYIFEEPWGDSYRALSAASDGIAALNSGLEIGDGGERNPRALAFATFVQGIAACQLSNVFDRAWTLDENTDLGAIEFSDAVGYQEMNAFAMGKLQAAEGLAASMGIPLESGWLNNNPLQPSEFAALVRSYRARCAANNPRYPSEVGDVNWAGVGSDASTGLAGGLTILGEETGPWSSAIKRRYSEEATWNRLHIDFVGMGDTGGSYQSWLAIPVTSRTAPDAGCDGGCMAIPDARMPQGGALGTPPADADDSPAIHPIMNVPYTGYSDDVIGRAERGTYRQSGYHSHMWDDLTANDFGPIPEVWDVEMDLLAAEAAINNNQPGVAEALIDKTRVTYGGLESVAGIGLTGTVPDCVPRKRFDPSGACGDINTALQWEHFNEIAQLSAGLTYFFARRQGILPSGTAVHYPLPALELETLQQDIYTFGGLGNEGSSGAVPTITPGNLNSALTRIAWVLETLERQGQLEQIKESNNDPKQVH
jgi:hypothetical protein